MKFLEKKYTLHECLSIPRSLNFKNTNVNIWQKFFYYHNKWGFEINDLDMNWAIQI
jgi:hypothetical protein